MRLKGQDHKQGSKGQRGGLGENEPNTSDHAAIIAGTGLLAGLKYLFALTLNVERAVLCLKPRKTLVFPRSPPPAPNLNAEPG
jgi:hypothetical protein